MSEAGGNRIVRVLPDVGAIRKVFDYVVPKSIKMDIRIGTQVRVPLQGRSVLGWVVADEVDPPEGVNLLPLKSVRGWGPPESVVSLAEWAAWRWAGKAVDFLGTASSPKAVRDLPEVPSSGPVEVAVPLISGLSGDTEVRQLWSADVRTHDGSGSGTYPRRSSMSRPDMDPDVSQLLEGRGVSVIRMAPAEDRWPVVEAVANLLRGSADWEVGSGSRPPTGELPGVLILVPELRQVAQLVRRLRRTGVAVASLPDQWHLARAGGCIAVGARSAAFAPLPKLLAALVLDAHDPLYREQSSPTWVASEAVVERARRDEAPCLIVSPCPTLDVLQYGGLVTPTRTHERGGWPPFEIIDRRQDDPRTGMYSPRLVDLLQEFGRSPDRRMICVLNRTGRVRLSACAVCGELSRCSECSGPLDQVQVSIGDEHDDVLKHEPPQTSGDDMAPLGNTADVSRQRKAGPATGERAMFRCRRCGRERPCVCARCGSTRFKSLRRGVTRVREEIEALIGCPVSELTASGDGPAPSDRSGTSEEVERHYDRALRSVIVGTDAALRRLDQADVVAFLDFDDQLLAPRFRAGEEALGTLALAARLVTRSARSSSGSTAGLKGVAPSRDPYKRPATAGRVIVQTRCPTHEVVESARTGSPDVLSEFDAEIRSTLGLPPFRAMALLSHAGAREMAKRIEEKLAEIGVVEREADRAGSGVTSGLPTQLTPPPGIGLSGPVDGVWTVTAPDHQALSDLLVSVQRPEGRLRIEVDPLSA